MDVVELKYLRKYIPFIRYLLANGETNVKFQQIMNWIDTNKRFKRKIADLIEESLKVRYTKQLIKNDLPPWVHELFKDKIEIIDLESSDDDSVVLLIPGSLEESNANTKKPQNTAKQIIGKDIPEDTNDDSLNKKTQQLIFKNPAVLLKKLTPQFLEKYNINPNNNTNKESTPLNVELVEGHKETTGDLVKSSKSEYKRPSTHIFLTNTDSDMTEKNTTTCIICYSKPQNLTNHFVRVHKVESYVSRLNDEVLNELHNNIRVAHPVKEESLKESPQYKVVCAFCDETLQDLFVNFYNHFSSHTGEYGYYCSFCKLKKPYLEDMLCHQKRARVCSAAKILTAYVYNVQHTVIYLFRCKVCNFVQLNAANIEKHILDHHGSHYSSNCIDKYIIASIDGETEKTQQKTGQSNSNSIDRTEIGITREELQQEKSNLCISIERVDGDMITTFNAAVAEKLTPLDEAEISEDYFTSIMLNADDLKIEVEDDLIILDK